MSESVVYSVFYDTTTGLIVACNTSPASMANEQVPPAGCALAQATGPFPDFPTYYAQNYVESGAVAARTAMNLTVSTTSIAANGTSEATITGIPSGASVTISGAVTAGPETITDGELVITSTTAGAIKVAITLRPGYQDWSTTINAS